MTDWAYDGEDTERGKHWKSWNGHAKRQSPRLKNFMSAGVFMLATFVVVMNGTT